MQCSRGHHQCNRDDDQYDGTEVAHLVGVGEAPEAVAEDRDHLKTEERLNARQHHPAFVEELAGGMGEVKRLGFVVRGHLTIHLSSLWRAICTRRTDPAGGIQMERWLGRFSEVAYALLRVMA